MSRTAPSLARTLARLRLAFTGQGVRGAIVGLALLLAGMQLALQTHSIEHDLLPSNHQVCEHCVVAKAAALPPVVAEVLPLSPVAIRIVFAAPSAPLSRAPLVERSRGPPALV